jgi:hypothetical protein
MNTTGREPLALNLFRAINFLLFLSACEQSTVLNDRSVSRSNTAQTIEENDHEIILRLDRSTENVVRFKETTVYVDVATTTADSAIRIRRIPSNDTAVENSVILAGGDSVEVEFLDAKTLVRMNDSDILKPWIA